MTFESRHRRKDGSEFPVEVRVRPFWHGNRRLNISVVRDISDRKRAEEAERRSERELRELIETIPAMAFAIGRDGSSEFVSRQWIEFSGMSGEQTTGEGWAATLTTEKNTSQSGGRPMLAVSHSKTKLGIAMHRATIAGYWFALCPRGMTKARL